LKGKFFSAGHKTTATSVTKYIAESDDGSSWTYYKDTLYMSIPDNSGFFVESSANLLCFPTSSGRTYEYVSPGNWSYFLNDMGIAYDSSTSTWYDTDDVDIILAYAKSGWQAIISVASLSHWYKATLSGYGSSRYWNFDSTTDVKESSAGYIANARGPSYTNDGIYCIVTSSYILKYDTNTEAWSVLRDDGGGTRTYISQAALNMDDSDKIAVYLNISGSPYYCSTTDGGTTWTDNPMGSNIFPTKVPFRAFNNMGMFGVNLSAGEKGFAVSYDNGASWIDITSFSLTALNDVCLGPSGSGIMFGYDTSSNHYGIPINGYNCSVLGIREDLFKADMAEISVIFGLVSVIPDDEAFIDITMDDDTLCFSGRVRSIKTDPTSYIITAVNHEISFLNERKYTSYSAQKPSEIVTDMVTDAEGVFIGTVDDTPLSDASYPTMNWSVPDGYNKRDTIRLMSLLGDKVNYITTAGVFKYTSWTASGISLTPTDELAFFPKIIKTEPHKNTVRIYAAFFTDSSSNDKQLIVEKQDATTYANDGSHEKVKEIMVPSFKNYTEASDLADHILQYLIDKNIVIELGLKDYTGSVGETMILSGFSDYGIPDDTYYIIGVNRHYQFGYSNYKIASRPFSEEDLVLPDANEGYNDTTESASTSQGTEKTQTSLARTRSGNFTETGVFISNNSYYKGRNAAGNDDIDIIGVDSDDYIEIKTPYHVNSKTEIHMKSGYTGSDLQDAIDSLSSGGIIYLPDGNRTISTKLTVTSHITIKGVSKSPSGGSILTSNVSSDYIMEITGDYVVLENLAINTSAAYPNGISISGDYYYIHNCGFSNTDTSDTAGNYYAIYSTGLRGIINANNFKGGYNAIHIYASTSSNRLNNISNNYFVNQHKSIVLENTNYAAINGNIFHSISGNGVRCINAGYNAICGNVGYINSDEVYFDANSGYNIYVGNAINGPSITDLGTYNIIANNS